MKKSKYFSVICLLLILSISVSSLQAQIGFRKGLKVGSNWANITNLDIDDTESLKSFTAGLSLEINLLNLLAIQADFLYSPKGVTAMGEDTHLNYFSVPVVLKKKFFPLGIHPYTLIGLEYGFLISAKAADIDIKDELNSSDMSIIVGGGVEFSLFGNGVYVEGRYNYGLKEITDNPDLLGDFYKNSKNKVLQVYLGILF